MRKTKPDIHLMTVNKIGLLWPKSKKAAEWMLQHFGNDYEVFAQGIVIEPHLIDAITKGLAESNLNYLIQRS
mgnify:CR=1 FL=1|tara:strand:+ start:1421 stop:1636 length:216 start_codon:yes stop_codon:yes gene_type:complete